MATTYKESQVTIVHTNVIDPTENYNQSLDRTYNKGTKLQHNGFLYELIGGDINPKSINDNDIIIGDIIYDVGVMKVCTSIDTVNIPKMPSEYTITQDDESSGMLSTRYMRLSTGLIAHPLFPNFIIQLGGITHRLHTFTLPNGSHRYDANTTNSTYSGLVDLFSVLENSSNERKSHQPAFSSGVGYDYNFFPTTLIRDGDSIYVRSSFDVDIEYKNVTVNQYRVCDTPSDLGFDMVDVTLPNRAIDMSTSNYASSFNNMTYTVQAEEECDSFVIAGVTATSINYAISNNDGSETYAFGDEIIDCLLTNNPAYGQGKLVKILKLDRILPAGTRLTFTLTNTIGTAYVGNITSNVSNFEGATAYDISRGYRDWSKNEQNILAEESNTAPVVGTVNFKIYVPISDINKTYERHKSFVGKVMTVDVTDAEAKNGVYIDSAIMRVKFETISEKILGNNLSIENYYEINMTAREVT